MGSEMCIRDRNIRGGDIDLSEDNTFFGNFSKRIQGLSINSSINESISVEAAGAIAKGKYKRTEITTQNGNQGPYKLVGQNGELYVLVVSGSESVFINGNKLERGIDKDYIINYNAGEIIFNSTFPIMADMRIQIEYQVSEKNYNSFIGFGKFQIKQNRVTHNISLYNENDVKNQPILQNISENQPKSENLPSEDKILSENLENKNETVENNGNGNKDHQVIHKKDGRLHIYVRQDKYKGELKSKNWVGRLYVDGKQKISSSGTQNLDEAIPILEKWYDDVINESEKLKKLSEEQKTTAAIETNKTETSVTETTASLKETPSIL